MWRRSRRRTLAPRRPAVFAEQLALAIVTVLVALASVAFVLYVVVGS